MVDMPNASNNGGGDDDGNENNDGNDKNIANDNGDTNGNNGNGPDGPSSDGPLDEKGDPNSKFGPFDEHILNEWLSSPCHDECHERLVRSAKKVVRDNKRLLQRM